MWRPSPRPIGHGWVHSPTTPSSSARKSRVKPLIIGISLDHSSNFFLSNGETLHVDRQKQLGLLIWLGINLRAKNFLTVYCTDLAIVEMRTAMKRQNISEGGVDSNFQFSPMSQQLPPLDSSFFQKIPCDEWSSRNAKNLC